MPKNKRDTFAPLLFSFFAALAFLVVPTNAQADQIFLKNGDKISGQMRLVTNDQVQFRTPYGGVLAIPKQDVAKIIHDDGSVWTDNTTPTSNITTTSTAQNQTADVAETPPDAKDYEPFSDAFNRLFGVPTEGLIKVGFNDQNGNTDKNALNVEAKIKMRLSEKQRLTVSGAYEYAEDNKLTTEDNRHIYGQYDYFFDPKWFFTTNGRFETDNQAAIDLEMDVGAGVGYQFYDEDDLKLAVTLGPNYKSRDFATGDTEESIGGRWTLDYEQKFFDDLLKLFHNHEITQGFDDKENFSLESVSGVSIPLNKYLRAIGQIEYDYREITAAGAENSDTTYSLNLGYEW